MANFCRILLRLILGVLLKTTIATAFHNESNPNPKNQPKPKMRAWTCHGKNQLELVDRLCQAKIIKSPLVRAVMEQVDRTNYVPNDPYMDAPQTIGLGQTISAPHMHAYVLEEIYPYLTKTTSSKSATASSSSSPEEPIRILDVGCGSGYLTAAFGRWLQSNKPTTSSSAAASGGDGKNSILFPNNGTPLHSKVFGIDVHPPLTELTRSNISKQDKDLLDTGLVTLALKDGWKGWPAHAPFDAIHVGAAAESLPEDLAVQLKMGGILIIPIGPNGGEQKLYKIERISDKGNTSGTYVAEDYRINVLLGVRYVPLVQHPEL